MLRLWHLTSLDAPTVAVAWALAFAWAGGLRLPRWVPVLLALGAWTVYIGDRLLDARSAFRIGAEHRLRERHYFHWRHRRVLTPLAVLAAGTAAVMILVLMPVAIRERNAALGVAALVYFSGVHVPGGRWLRHLPKEFLVGVLFTAGCTLPTITRLKLMGATWDGLAPLAIAAVVFAGLAWLNCHAIERWESGDGEGAYSSWRAAVVLAAVSLGLGLVMLWLGEAAEALLMVCAAASALLLGALDLGRERLDPLALRAAADVVLLTPLVCLLR